MDSWLHGLKNVQSQLTDFTREVLTETTEEVDDPVTELQICRKKLLDTTEALTLSRGDVEKMRVEVADLRERAEASELRLDTIHLEHRQELIAKDAQITKLKQEISGLSDRVGPHGGISISTSGFSQEHDHSPPISPNSPGSDHFEMVSLKGHIKHLEAEVQHWKSVVREADDGANNAERISELTRQLEETVDKHQDEISALQHSYNAQINALKHQLNAQRAGAQQSCSKTKTSAEDDDEGDGWSDSGWTPNVTMSVSEASYVTASNTTVTESTHLLQQQVDELQVEKEDQREQIELLESQIALLHEQKRTAKKAEEEKLAVADRKLADLEDELVEKTEQLLVVENKLAKMGTSDSALTELQAELAEIKKQREQALNSNNELEQRLKDTVAQFENNNSEMTRLQSEIAELRQRNEELASTNHDIVNKTEGLEQQLAQMESSTNVVTGLQFEHSELINQNSQLKKEINELTERTKLLEAMEEKMKQLENSNCAVFDLQSELAEVKKQHTQMQNENRELTEAYSDLSAELETLKKGVVTVPDVTGAVDVQRQIESLTGQVDSLTLQNEALKAKYECIQEKAIDNQTRVDTLQTELQEVNTVNEELTVQNITLNEKLVEVTRERELASAVEQSGKDEHVDQPKSVAALSTTHDIQEVVNLRSKLHELRTCVIRYRAVVGEEAAKIVEMRDSGSSGSSSVHADGDSNGGWDRLADLPDLSQLRVSTSQQHTTESANASPSSSTAVIEQELDSIKIQLRESLAALTEKTDECESLSKQLTDKQLESNEREEMLQQSFTELKGLECQLAESREREKNLKVNVNRLTADTARMHQETDELRVQLERSAERIQEYEEERDALMQQTGQEYGKEEELVKQLHELGHDKNQLQATVQHLTEQLDASALSASNLDSEVDSLTSQLTQLQSSLDSSQNELGQLQVKLQSTERELAESRSHDELSKNMQTEVTQLTDRLTEREAAVQHANAALDTVKQQLTTLQSEREQMVALITSKHEESVRYHGELQSALAQVTLLTSQLTDVQQRVVDTSEQQRVQQQLEQAINNNEQLKQQVALLEQRVYESESKSTSINDELARVQNELSSERANREQDNAVKQLTEMNKHKSEKEVERLRMHLVQLEENYTREAIAAEERETELRQRVLELEQINQLNVDSSSSTKTQLMDELADVKVQLDSIKQQRDSALLQLSSSEEDRQRQAEAIANLQAVLESLQSENSSQHEHLTSEHRNTLTQLTQQVSVLSSQLAACESSLASTSSQNSAHEAECRRLRLLVQQRDDELQQLDKQMSTMKQDLINVPTSSVGAAKFVDKELLRNLILGYFTAPEDKKHDVILLLASVLSFTKNDMERIDASARPGWFGFLSGRGATPEYSITAQFIKFLETESQKSDADRAEAQRKGVSQPLTLSGVASINNKSGHGSTGPPTPALQFDLPSFDNPHPDGTTDDFLREALQD